MNTVIQRLSINKKTLYWHNLQEPIENVGLRALLNSPNNQEDLPMNQSERLEIETVLEVSTDQTAQLPTEVLQEA